MTDDVAERLARLIVDEIAASRATTAAEPLDPEVTEDTVDRINVVLRDGVERLRRLANDVGIHVP